MKVAVRYYSVGGNVKLIAEALARGAGVPAISIDEPEGPLREPVDILFLGGATHNFKLDPKLIQYIEDMPEGIVTDRVICFGSSAFTRRPIYSIMELLKKKNFKIGKQAVWARKTAKPTALAAFEFFAHKQVEITSEDEALPPVSYMIRAVKDEMRAEEEAAQLSEEQQAVAELNAAAEEATEAAEAAALMAAEAAARAKELAERAAAAKAEAEALVSEAEQAAEQVAEAEELDGAVVDADTQALEGDVDEQAPEGNADEKTPEGAASEQALEGDEGVSA